jgi:hypothetical protein
VVASLLHREARLTCRCCGFSVFRLQPGTRHVRWMRHQSCNLAQEARQRANLERAAQLEALLHAAFFDAAHPPDLEFGCFAAVLGPRGSGFEGEALLRIDTGVRCKNSTSDELECLLERLACQQACPKTVSVLACCCCCCCCC